MMKIQLRRCLLLHNNSRRHYYYGPSVNTLQLPQLLQQQHQFHTTSTTNHAAAAAASQTGAQKRALQQHQISPSTKAPGTAGTTATTTTAAATTTNNNNNNNTPIIAAAVAVVAGGGAFYYFNNNNKKKKSSDVVVATDTETKDTVVAAVSEKEKVTAATAAAAPTVIEVTAPSPSSSTVSSTPTAAVIANRVTEIQVPAKMKNTSASSSSSSSSIATIDHPVHGNRVTNIFPNSSKESTHETASEAITQTTTTQQAIQELQLSPAATTTTNDGMESLIQSHQSMWSTSSKSVDGTTTTTTTMEQLQIRIGQLQQELQDRTKWEAIRLKEFLLMKEKEVSDRYVELLQKQRIEFEDLMAKKLREQEHVMAQQYYQAIQEKEATIQNVLQTALEAQKQEYEEDKKVWEEMTTMNIQGKVEEQYMQQLEEYKIQMSKSLQEKAQQMQVLADTVQQLQIALETSQSTKEGSLKAHRISAAALALTEKLQTHDPAKMELETLKLAAGNVGVISTACSTIPISVSQTGVPTLSELQTKFVSSVQPKCRQAAFVPKGRVGLEGQLAGMLFSTIRYAPSYDDIAPEKDVDDTEYILVRAKQYVQVGELEAAINELDKLTGQPAFIVADWKKDAIDRVNVEKALKVIKMECALLNESCLEN